MTKLIREPARDITVLLETDVLVAGGGVAGCAAAYGAARAGAKTVMVERNGCLGGVATASYMANIGNLMITGDNTRVIEGFTGEVIQRLVDKQGASPQWADNDVPGCVIDSERLKVVLIEMLQEEGVEILTHTVGAEPIVEDDIVKGAFIESKEGRLAILAGNTVDATGEADLAYRADCETTYTGGSASTLFKIANVDMEKFVASILEDPEGFPDHSDMTRDAATFERNWKERGIFFFPHGGGRKWRWFQEHCGDLDEKRDMAWNLNALGLYALKGPDTIVVNSNFYTIDNLETISLSQKELHSQAMCYYVGEYLIRKLPGFEKGHITAMGSDLGIRTSRKIVGRTVLKKESLRCKGPSYLSDDVIAREPQRDDDWDDGTYRKNTTCDIPFGIMVPKGASHLLVASAKSVDTEPAGLIRGMYGCMVCGQAAGVAAALGSGSGQSAAEVPIREIQKSLIAQNVNLGEAVRLKDLGLA